MMPLVGARVAVASDSLKATYLGRVALPMASKLRGAVGADRRDW
jgi:hypothetical protein